MNLIEEYGSYEKASKACDKEIKDGGYPHDFIARLLEYRRANDIFEVGDFIVLLHTNYRSDVFALTKSFKEIYDEKGIAYRHATPKEIEQGFRSE